MESKWKYLINAFESSTRTSYLEAMKISDFHENALAAKQKDAFFGTLYKYYLPYHTTYKEAYNEWTLQETKQSGKTVKLTQLFQELASTKIDGWDIFLQNVYNKNTPEYKAILPHRRIPFQNGKQVERINAVKTLAKAISGDASLKKIKDDVDSFLKQLETADANQKVSKSDTTTYSQSVEAARIAMCNAQYANLGAMMQKFNTDPLVITAYFDLQIIRRAKQLDYTGHVKPQQVHTIVKHTFAATAQVALNNLATTDLHFYLSQTKDAKLNAGITIKAGEQGIYPATILGNIEYSYFIVYNPHTVETGQFEVELL